LPTEQSVGNIVRYKERVLGKPSNLPKPFRMAPERTTERKPVRNTEMVMVTGASGFIGRAVVTALSAHPGYVVRRACRQFDELERRQNRDTVVVALGPHSEWTAALKGVAVVVHTAARVHSMKDPVETPIDDFLEVNVLGTLHLARQAAIAGVRRFVFMSSVKVFGEQSVVNRPFVESDACAPKEAYAASKWEAEQALMELAAQTSMEVVIIRAPLVYGAGARANFQTLVHAVARGIPLPFGAVSNSRSLVAIDNLVDLIATCLDHPNAGNQTFSVSDVEDLSTPELVRRIAFALSRPARLIAVPVFVLKLVATLGGQQALFQRLCGNLQVDTAKAASLLGWSPPVRVDEALLRAVGRV
jgi:nucleoside-diphosphate-sugar epimerase